jgi:Zn finger protein HypA/HybF involved in hydrogenase expression
MIKIIEMGKIPDSEKFEVKCENCKTVFSYYDEDVCKNRNAYENTTHSYVKCPLCKQDIEH